MHHDDCPTILAAATTTTKTTNTMSAAATATPTTTTNLVNAADKLSVALATIVIGHAHTVNTAVPR